LSLNIGIVGMPNVGKSTLFNALVKGSRAQAANYPFCTIDPNVGIVEVPDERLAKLSIMSKSVKTVPAAVEFVDIAGLVKGASKGEGLGNKFLSHIRDCQAIAMVVRFFKDDNIIHVAGHIEPFEDIGVIETELQLADLSTVEKRLSSIDKELKAAIKDPASVAKYVKSALEKIKAQLDMGHNARDAQLDEFEKSAVKELALMTQKPILFVANVSEAELSTFKTEQEYKGRLYHFIPISAKLEEELNTIPDEEKAEYFKTLGITDSGRDRLIKEAYNTLGLITYITSGEKETKAWTIHKGDTAPKAAGAIHSDFERGFIAADVIGWNDLVGVGGWHDARTKGLVRTEGKQYVVKDGDVIIFKFNV
jgi:GTP-binding protein YchF